MPDILKAKFRYVRYVGIIVIGMMLIGMQTVYGGDLRPVPTDEGYDEAVEPQFALGDTDRDFVFTPVKPCRILDTRNAGGPISAFETRAFYVHGSNMSDQGGNPNGCTAPRGEPRAVHINIAVDAPLENGFLTVWPTGTARPKSAVLNYRPTYSDPISNSFTVITGFNIDKDINVYAFTQTDVIADVMGYYYEVDSVFIDEGFTTGPGAIPTNTIQFLAAPTQVTVTRSNQKIYVVSNKAFGAGATAAANLDLWICYRQIPAGTIQTVGGGSLGIRVPANTRVPMGLSAFISVNPGNYDVGLCGNDNSNGNWTSNEWSYTTAFVVED